MKTSWLASVALLMAATVQSAPAPEPLTEAEEEAVADAPAVADEADEDDSLTPRGRYNLGIERLDANDTDAATDAFLTARDEAGPDPVLRYRAAFNLGFALAEGVAEDASPEDAIEQLRQSAAWFNDALRLAPPNDEDARINLELVSRRIMQLADQLNADDRLETRLDRLIDDQRGLRDQVRGLLADVSAEQAGAEPLGFKNEFDGLASRERTLMAEVGDCIDLAAEERLFIEQTPEEERTQEQQGRVYRLQAVNDYLERARQSLGDARRRLRRLEGERGHRRADAALAELKRAREQLLDPLTVLNAIARDELELTNQTGALAEWQTGQSPDEAVEPPPWLTLKHLGERQEDVAARTGGVLGGFEAISSAPPAESPEQQRLAESVSEAIPLLRKGLDAMRETIAAFAAEQPRGAVAKQQDALKQLRLAIELFADAKGLIELAYASQHGIETLLNPTTPESAELADADRAEAVFTLAQENQRRLTRLEALLQEERQEELAAALAQAEADSDEADSDAPPDASAQQAIEQRYQRAEELRASAQTALTLLENEVQKSPNSQSARDASGESMQAIDELRRLFFSIVEHLQALHADQADTHDRTATLQFEASADMTEQLPSEIGAVANRQSGHAQLGDALANALAEQADAAAAQPVDEAAAAQEADAEKPASERLAEAAAEVRKAGGLMHSASAVLNDAAPKAATMSPELEPALDDQVAALEHLENALRALSPEGERNRQSQQQQGQGESEAQEAQQAQQEPSEEQMSQRQALRRLQAIRDREADRQRRRANPTAPEPVEKDW